MDRTPPGTPKKGGKMLAVRVQMLDDSITMFQVQAKALGRVLFDQVCKQLHLLESDYFGLEYQEIGGTKYWLDLEKPLSRQIGLSLVDTLVKFCVKFYTPDPSQLEEEFTRYLFCLQIKRDLAQGLLQCNDNTAALMASYIVQAECGDYVVEDYPDHRYLSSYKFVPNQDQELERRIMENHKKHIGQSPAEADLNLLETARRCELYGIKMHPAKDHEGVPLNLAVAHMGIVVFQNYTKINTFSWAKIRKISFKRKRFLVKLHPEGYGYYKDIVEFFFEGRNECKNFWKKCVENHGFFRCSMVKRVPRQKTRVLSRGSSFRYSGRTQKQVVEFVRENYVKRQTFQRSQSFRHSSSAHSSVANVGTSISAHPLLPLGDNAVAGTPASLSCGSMTLTSSPVHAADLHGGGSPSPPLTTSVSPGTSVTSSPQHFYLQETPYRRTGHPHSRLNHPQEHSRRTTSPRQSPTNVATAAITNRSASHSNSNNNANGNLLLDNDLKSSRISLKNNTDLMYFNDVYSNLYSSLRNLGYSNENVDNAIDDKGSDAKIEISSLSRGLTNAKSNESVKSRVAAGAGDEARSWLRSSSCKNLYHQGGDGSRGEKGSTKGGNADLGYDEEEEEEDASFKMAFDSPVTRYDDARRGCYSAAASKATSVDGAGDVDGGRVYSRSYPGTTSSLSTESVEAEPAEVIDVNDSQDEIGLSHDDVSHDSYELLEKELDEFDDGYRGGNKTRKMFAESERARSCSWGSDKIASPLDSRSSDKIFAQDHARSRENGFRSLERSRSPKHKSETDFRSLDRKSPKGGRNRGEGGGGSGSGSAGIRPGERKYVTDHRRKSRESYKKDAEEGNKVGERVSPMNGRMFNLEERELYRNYENEVAMHRRKYQERSRSQEEVEEEEESEIFRMDPEEEKEEEEKKKKVVERRREKKEKEERFHEGIREKDWERRLYERAKPAEDRRFDKDADDGKKIERVFANQFGKYPEFSGPDYELLRQEKKVSENYEKVCQVGKIAKELERSEKALSEMMQTVPKADAETRKEAASDAGKKPFRVSQFNEYNAKIKGGTVIGFSPKTSPKPTAKVPVERTKSDPYENAKNSKRNVLTHQKSIDLTPQDSAEATSDYDNDDRAKKTSRSEYDIPYILRKRHFMNGTAKDEDSSKEGTGSERVEVASADAKEEKNAANQSKRTKPAIAKKPAFLTAPKEPPKKEYDSVKEDEEEDDLDEPIYAQVIKGKVVVEEKAATTTTATATAAAATKKKTPPVPPKRTSSVVKAEAVQPSPPERTSSLPKVAKKTPPEPPVRTTSVPKKAPPEKEVPSAADSKRSEFPKSGVTILAHKREELFARTRLGLSEGSAFAPVPGSDSPSCQRRAKSLDAPVVSVHRLPPADAFSSKDDTVDEVEDVMNAAVGRGVEAFKAEAKKGVGAATSPAASTESEVDVFLPEDVEDDRKFKEMIERESSKFEMPYPEERVLDVMRSKRLLSKIDSIDSEGDPDSSRKAEPLPIPSDRLVNLPESIRFPSVRQISGQTSEESGDGWEQPEMKVRRRTPRRSVGREEQDAGIGESVVWDSKDDEPPDDDVWDNNAVFTLKHNGHPKGPDAPGTGSEYLKRGSCGQSIDDDNVSTPMKESSPEHWVSVDDLPEAIEREEKFLREQEKILREKILNEKLKRELNLDTVNVDRRLLDAYRQSPEIAYKDNKFKGHSLDTYELTEKRLRERGTNKNCSLDEHILRQSPIKTYLSISSNLDASDKSSSYENVPKKTKMHADYIKCKVVNNVYEIDQFGDNDEELEEFVVVLDEGLGDGKDGREVVWDDITFRGSLSKEESLISVPEEFKDVEEEEEEEEEEDEEEVEEVASLTTEPDGLVDGGPTVQQVEIRLDAEEVPRCRGGDKDVARVFTYDDAKVEDAKASAEESAQLSPYRDAQEEKRRPSSSEDTGRLSPYDSSSSRRGSDDPRRGSASDDADRLSPFDDGSRRGSEDPRRLSTSEDSKHYSVSESVSEETRRRLSSTEETRRKRASLTKQCSVGVDSLSDDMIPGIQECSSSFEQDEKDVFESTTELPPLPETARVGKLEIEVSEPKEEGVEKGREEGRGEEKEEKEEDERKNAKEEEKEENHGNHLAPPNGERELSRETEDSMDYGEGDFKDIREAVKEKDISEGLICDNESVRSRERAASSFEKSESSEVDELRYIDDKRGSTPEMIVGKSREAAAISVVVVNEGISVLNKIVEMDRSRTLPAPIPAAGSTSTDSEAEEQRHTLPKAGARPNKPKPLAPKPDYLHRKLTKAVPNAKAKAPPEKPSPPPPAPAPAPLLVETSQESSQESDVDRLAEVSLLAQIQNQIARRNLADAGKRLRRDVIVDVKDDARKVVDKKSPEQEKRDSGEDVSSSSSAPPHPKRELSSTWRPFLLESSGSSSLEEGWLPPDDNAHLADEEETSSNSNNQQDDSVRDDVIDYPTGIGYPVLNLSGAEMMVGGYGGVFALSRTLSRISERSTSEQERSDAEDDVTKPTSRSVSIEEESIISSDHQPSLSSDSASPKAEGASVPELPDDRSPIPESFVIPEDEATNAEPFADVIPPPVTDEDWPSPPSSSSVFDTPVVSHVETFYMEIHPEEACKVIVAEPQHEENSSSSDENQTLQEEGELLQLSSDNLSVSTTTTTTQDGTVVVPVHPPNLRTNSASEDASLVSASDWSSSAAARQRPNSNFGTTEDLSEWTKSPTGLHARQTPSADEISEWPKRRDEASEARQARSGGERSPQGEDSPKAKPPKLKSPPNKSIGFFETPISKVRSPTSQVKFFERSDKVAIKSPTSRSESASPKNHGRFFDGYHSAVAEHHAAKPLPKECPPEPDRRGTCTPYYSNVADKGEKSYFLGQCDSLERTKIQASRKSVSYHSVVRIRGPSEEDVSCHDPQSPPPTSNTIPRASKKTRRRHRVAVDIQIRDGKMVAPPKTRSTVLENSDSDRSSPSSRRKASDT